MKAIQHFIAAGLCLGAGLAASGAACADSVLYDSTSLVQGAQAFTQSFNVTTPGTLTVTLTDIPWLDTVSNLTGFVSTSSGVVGTTMAAGTQSFDISAGTVYTHWFGDANGAYNLGVLGVKIQFSPSATTPVPLPASLLLLLSGMGMLFGWQRRERANGAAPQSLAQGSMPALA